ncbi:DNA repair protein REV1 [Galdieria sulphuraria]|nr:DNA repair protein REV1 [Galdieria sulphuraria]
MESFLVDNLEKFDTSETLKDWDGDFRAYMDAKEDKLRVQFHKEFENTETCKVFSGVTIWVDGETSPSREELRQLMGLGGGNFETYFSRHLVTHIVAENLSASKIKELKKYRLHSICVVRPQYLTPGILDDHQKQLQTINEQLNNSLVETDIVHGTKPDRTLYYRRTASHSTNENPNFVRDFFAQSRLHFIGSFRARYEKILARMVAEEGTLCKLPYDRSKTSERVIFHVDMDCFFAAVSLAKTPSLRNQPIAVCHARQNSEIVDSSCEISSANYEARAFGIHAGMFVGEARKLAPSLITVPYDFEAYEKTSELIYRKFLEYAERVEAVSVDEAYLEMTGIVLPVRMKDKEIRNIEDLAMELRLEIERISGCTASIGIGSNKTLARLATKKAKPNGQFAIWSHEAMEKLSLLPVEELPGVGWMTRRRLHSMNIFICQQLRELSLERLEKEFGKQTALSIFETCRGKDERPLELYRPPKSIGAEVNWGVRFENNLQGVEKCKKFILDIVDVVCERLKAADAKATKLTYKVLRKQRNAPPPRKYLGCGLVDEFSKSTSFPISDSALEIGPRCLTLHESLNIPLDELRGVGIHCFGLEFSSHHHKRHNSGITLSKYFQLDRNPQQLRIDGCLKMSRMPSKQNIMGKTMYHEKSNDIRVSPNNKRSNHSLDELITKNGWSREVFVELPNEIQQELLKDAQSCNQRVFWGNSSAMSSFGVSKRARSKCNKTNPSFLQPTLTQLDDIYQAKDQGLSQLVVAEEFQTRSIRECLEILQDVEHAKKPKIHIPLEYSNMVNSVRQEQETWYQSLHNLMNDPFVELSKHLRIWITQIQSFQPDLRRKHQEALFASVLHEVENGRLYQVQGFMRLLVNIAREHQDNWIPDMVVEIEEIIQCAMRKTYNGAVLKLD